MSEQCISVDVRSLLIAHFNNYWYELISSVEHAIYDELQQATTREYVEEYRSKYHYKVQAAAEEVSEAIYKNLLMEVAPLPVAQGMRIDTSVLIKNKESL